MNYRSLSLTGIILFAAMARILPHPWNMSPVAAVALFGGAQFKNRWAAFLLPLSALFLSDLVLGFYHSMWLIYGAFAFVVCIGILIRGKRSPGVILGAAIASSVSFFLISNFGTWFFENLYSKNWQGLMACYTAALPFFQGTLVGDLSYSAALFGAFYLAERTFPSLREIPSC